MNAGSSYNTWRPKKKMKSKLKVIKKDPSWGKINVLTVNRKVIGLKSVPRRQDVVGPKCSVPEIWTVTRGDGVQSFSLSPR